MDYLISFGYMPLVSTFTINRLPRFVLKSQSLYQLLYAKNLYLYFLKSFRCECFPYVRNFNKHKLLHRLVPYIILGYALNHIGYLCYNLITKKLYTSWHAIFNEHFFPSKVSSTCPNPSHVDTFYVPFFKHYHVIHSIVL